MILLATDFGLSGPYVGQVHLALARAVPNAHVINLISDLPNYEPMHAGYLLAALAEPIRRVPPGAIVLGVVDPGVGGERNGIIVEADGCFYVGPDNGLFSMIVRRAKQVKVQKLPSPPEDASPSFHGRDVFAPAAAMILRGERPDGCTDMDPGLVDRARWPDDLPEVIYLDSYGNAMTGLRASTFSQDSRLTVAGCLLPRVRTFSDGSEGQPFFYENANGLLEVAAYKARADRVMGLRVGFPIGIAETA